ncbi:MAG: hypothetical protein WCS65_09610 [Verrucomicrobiae bacterium]
MTIEVRDLATPELQRISKLVSRPRLLLQACGRRVAKDLKAGFRDRDKEPNSHGWWKSHWWNREVAQKTAYQGATDTEATVSIASKQFRHFLLGGRVVGHPYLAIPLTEQAKRKGSPGEWTKKGDGQLTFLRSKTGACYLFPGEGKSHNASYLLVRSVTHKPHPDAIPTDKIEAGVDDEASKFLERITK